MPDSLLPTSQETRRESTGGAGIYLARLTTSGTLDSSFGSSGEVNAPLSGNPSGLSVALLEGRSAIGGRIRTRRMRGCAVPIELGAEFVHGRSEDVFEIASAAALLVDRLPDSYLAVTKSGWKPQDAFFDRFERITRLMRRTGRDRSVADFLRVHRSLSPVQKRLAASIVEGYHAAPLDRASEHALSTAGDAPSSPEEHAQFRVVAGYDGVTNWLRSRLEPRRCGTFLSTPVR